jgi:tetratricopeptide (TPR) repeat protein
MVEPLRRSLLPVADWQKYEREIEEQFREAYPSARITRDAKLVGKFSKVERQIDLLIEEQASDFAFRIIVDAKHRGRKIDVGDVESFLGLTRDVEAHTGMMVALEGYTPAAINRAHYDNLDVILDVLNFDELKAFQGRAAIPYAGECGVSIAAPFGWVVDATRRSPGLAKLYQRGLSFEEALRNDEWMYINFWNKKNHPEVNSLDALLKYQEAYILKGSPDAEIRLSEGAPNQRVGAKTLVRRLKIKTHPAPEYTGFVDFENFIFMCVLFTPEQLERKNLRKLHFLLRDAFPMTVTYDHTALIRDAKEKLKELSSDRQRAWLLSKIGWWYEEMGRLQDARESLEKSLALVPGYETVKQLLATLTKLDDKNATLELMGRLLRLYPHNPTVFDDCIMYAGRSTVGSADLLDLFETLGRNYPDDQLVQANCNFYAAKILLETDPESARNRLTTAQSEFRKLFPRGHQVFAELRSTLRQLS